MDMLRHTSPAMTMHYATAKLDDMRRVAGSVETQLEAEISDLGDPKPCAQPTTFRELTAYLSRFSPDVLLQALREVGLQPTL